MAREPAGEGASRSGAAESSGVEELIGRLRDQGIAQGQGQADGLIAAARQSAAAIVSDAQRDADAIVTAAKEQAGKLRLAGEDAVRLAMRDTILSIEGDLLNQFVERLRRLVRDALAEPDLLQRMIQEVAGQAAPAIAGKTVQVLLPAAFVSLEDLQRKPEEATPGSLMHFVLTMGDGMLREGMTFGVCDDGETGIRVRLVDDDMQIDLTESAISQLLLRHMVPRFRALLRGAVSSKPAGAGGDADKRPGPARP